MNPRSALCLVMSVAITLTACGDGGIAPSDVGGLTIFSGDNQVRFPQSTLAKDLIVQVVDEAGASVATAGIPVDWAVVTGGGTIEPSSTTTDNLGRTEASWTLGPVEGAQSAEARAGGITASFAARAAQGGPIAFESSRSGGQRIFLMNEDGSDVIQLTKNAVENDVMPRWSPDGRRVVFGRGGVFVIDADGTNETRLTGVRGVVYGVGWSPDGMHIAFSGVGDEQGCVRADINIFVINADGSRLSPITSGCDQGNAYPDWSPDGSTIVFVSNRDRVDRLSKAKIFIMNPDGTAQKRLKADSLGFPNWSPDGSRILYVRAERDIMSMASDGTDEVMHYQGRLFVQHPEWSPDGASVIFVQADEGGSSEILLLDLATSDVTSLVSGSWNGFPSWRR